MQIMASRASLPLLLFAVVLLLGANSFVSALDIIRAANEKRVLPASNTDMDDATCTRCAVAVGGFYAAVAIWPKNSTVSGARLQQLHHKILHGILRHSPSPMHLSPSSHSPSFLLHCYLVHPLIPCRLELPSVLTTLISPRSSNRPLHKPQPLPQASLRPIARCMIS